jgi:hypothetical protein
MARQFYGYLTATDAEDVPFDTARRLQRVLEDSGFSGKELVLAAVMDDRFRAISGPPDDPVAGLRTVRPEQYARTIEDLTGYRWFSNTDRPSCDDRGDPDVQRFGTQCWGDVDLSESDVFGFRAMAGGVDGKVVLEPTRSVTPTKTLVMAQLAADAAAYVVSQDLARPAAERRLLRLVEAADTTSPAVRAQLAWLHLRVLGETVDPGGPEVDADLALVELGGWELALSALFQDPRMMFH